MADNGPVPVRIHIKKKEDILEAVLTVTAFAKQIGFDNTKQYMIATSASEMATNIFHYAGQGTIYIKKLEAGSKKEKGIEILAIDNGPGIEDLTSAMRDHFSTSGSLGVGLPGVRRLMDEFNIDSQLGKGVRVTGRKWL